MEYYQHEYVMDDLLRIVVELKKTILIKYLVWRSKKKRTVKLLDHGMA